MFIDRTFTPAEICELFGISKSTLLRWEREGLLEAVARGVKLNTIQRQYTPEHIRAICAKQKAQLIKQLEVAKDDHTACAIWESLYVLKFILSDQFSMRELSDHPQLSAATMRRLLHIATLYEPNDPRFVAIIEVLLVQSRKLSEQRSKNAEVAV